MGVGLGRKGEAPACNSGHSYWSGCSSWSWKSPVQSRFWTR